jgi:ESCRT-II complex subunit VPS25
MLILSRILAANHPLVTCVLHVGIICLPGLSPTIHSEQFHVETQATQTALWIRLILGYARHNQIFTLRVDDAETKGDWGEIFRNDRLGRTSQQDDQQLSNLGLGRLQPTHLAHILTAMVAQSRASWDSESNARTVTLFWRLPQEWAELLHEWVIKTKFANIIVSVLSEASRWFPQANSTLS